MEKMGTASRFAAGSARKGASRADVVGVEVATGSLGVLDRDYSALSASPFARLRAAPSGVMQRVALQSEGELESRL
jgi:hypothetical protein